MKRSYWAQFGCCAILLILLVVSRLHGEWYLSLNWPWNGLFGLGVGLLEVLSPFVFIYLVVLAMNIK
jgi:hypothetical protein